MELIYALIGAGLPAAMPLLVTGLTSVFKRLPVFSVSDGMRTVLIRLMAATFSLVSAAFIFMLGGDPVTETSVSEFAYAFMTFIGAVGIHEMLKRK